MELISQLGFGMASFQSQAFQTQGGFGYGAAGSGLSFNEFSTQDHVGFSQVGYVWDIPVPVISAEIFAVCHAGGP